MNGRPPSAGSYTKPYLSVSRQIALLRARGLDVPDDPKAEEYLSRIGYYRLSAYWYPFRAAPVDSSSQLSDTFKAGSSFKTAVDLYAFDKALRLQLLDALERIEIAIRTFIALQIGKHDPWAHRIPSLLHPRFAYQLQRSGRTLHADWLQKLDDKAASSKEEFADHFRRKYPRSPMPVWIAVELLDFGPLSHLLSGLRGRDQGEIAVKLGVSRANLLVSWVRSLAFVRNVCAHHARLWNRPLIEQPRLPAPGEIPLLEHLATSPYVNRRVYSALAVARYLLLAANPRTKWPIRLRDHIATFPRSQLVSIKTSGFPPDWDTLPLWQ
jgi:abortive infection bacteriophage resistance protein